MRIYKCEHCGQLVYFENTYCERCGHALGFVPETLTLATLEPAENNHYHLYNKQGSRYRYCQNFQYGVCNWLLPADSPDIYCPACELNNTIPDISSQQNIAFWQQLEIAKHRIVYSLLRLKLPLVSKTRDSVNGLAFNFLADFLYQDRILTGHDNGLITINLEEADDLTRERVRTQMREPYRTLLGHFRHETGHYYWDRLVMSGGKLNEFRQQFGDEQADYNNAIQFYYANPTPLNWQQIHISEYASSHPWEDWAETWAHYMHMMDTLETAWSFGLNVRPRTAPNVADLTAKMDIDPYELDKFEDIVSRWLPFTYAMNSINRSMGLKDLYPFVMSPEVINKLDFIHRLCKSAQLAQPIAYAQPSQQVAS